MNNLYDVLEICLQELENGVDLETVLARYPDLASELRPILNASTQARMMSVSAPSPDAVRRGRAKLLQRASEMREAKVAPRKRMIPVFQRLAISFSLTALFLTSGTGLVGASSSALPGEKLYPVKLTWENVRLFFTFSNEAHEALEHAFEDERLQEVNELLVEGRHETIQFSGVYTVINGLTYVSGIQLTILDTSILPLEPLTDGIAVTVTGRTNSQNLVVEVESITLLPTGSIVPTGEPVEVDSHSGSDNENNNVTINENSNENSNENDNGNENDNINTNENSNDNENTNSTSSENENNNKKPQNGNDDSSSGDSNNNSGGNDSSDDDGNDTSGSGGGGGDDSNDSNSNS